MYSNKDTVTDDREYRSYSEKKIKSKQSKTKREEESGRGKDIRLDVRPIDTPTEVSETKSNSSDVDKDGITNREYNSEGTANSKPTKAREQIIELHINKLQPYFSQEELHFPKEAVTTNHMSQTHFTNPKAGYCYRCPLCQKLINCENLATCLKLHFNMMHYDPMKEYSIIINGKYDHPINIQNIRKRGRNREGATPPEDGEVRTYCKEIQQSNKKHKKQKVEGAQELQAETSRENPKDKIKKKNKTKTHKKKGGKRNILKH